MAHGSTQERASFVSKLLRRSVGSSRLFPPPKTGARELNADNPRWAAMSEVRTSVHEDGLALLHIPTGRMFLCNRTGARIWQGIVKGLSIEAIAEEISRECGVARALVERHTSSFLAELESRGLVTRRTGADRGANIICTFGAASALGNGPLRYGEFHAGVSMRVPARDTVPNSRARIPRGNGEAGLRGG